MAAIRKRDGYDWKFEAEERSREVAKLKAAIKEIAEHVEKHGCTSADTYGLRQRIAAAEQLIKHDKNAEK